jgi:hypothetical protein
VKIRHRGTRTITHAELAALLAEHGQISLPTAKRLLRCTIICIAVALQYGHTVKIIGLGTFKPIARRSYKALGGLVAGKEGAAVRFIPSGSVLKAMQDSYYKGFRGRRKAKFVQPPVDQDTDSAAGIGSPLA